MKKLLLSSLLVFGLTVTSNAQIGIGTTSPDASAQLEVDATNKGLLTPRLTQTQRTAITTPATGLLVYQTNNLSGFYYYDGSGWTRLSNESFGDIKMGAQTTDHSGWVLLNGRAVSTLSANQQTVASSLGFTVNLPNATDAYPVQDGNTIGTVSGANTVTLTQANLPNVNFTGTAASAGDHTHDVDPASFNSQTAGAHTHTGSTSIGGSHTHSIKVNNNSVIPVSSGNVESMKEANNNWTDGAATHLANVMQSAGSHTHTLTINSNGDHAHSIDVPNTSSTTAGAHTHSVSVSSGGSGTAVDISPKSLTVNLFIYLGE